MSSFWSTVLLSFNHLLINTYFKSKLISYSIRNSHNTWQGQSPLIIPITVSSGMTSLISLSINTYGYICLIFNIAAYLSWKWWATSRPAAGGLRPGPVKDALRALAIGPWPAGSAEQTCQQEQAGPPQRLEDVPWPVARDKTSLGRLQQASVDRELGGPRTPVSGTQPASSRPPGRPRPPARGGSCAPWLHALPAAPQLGEAEVARRRRPEAAGVCTLSLDSPAH